MGGSLALAACDWLRAERSWATTLPLWLADPQMSPFSFLLLHAAVTNSNSHIVMALIHFPFQPVQII